MKWGGNFMQEVNRKTFDKTKIKAILFDSGRVLNEPSTGHWFITNNFFTIVDKKKFYSTPSPQIKFAFHKAAEYINNQKLIIDENEEYIHFFNYYSIFSTYLPELNLRAEDVHAITKDYVYNYRKYKFFEDSLTIVPKLSTSYKLAVVSDAWPSLENVFRAVGLRDYFSSFIISSQKGITKPHELMYKTALEELGVLSEEAIFIDDNIKNCQGAMNLGIYSFVLCRDFKSYIYHKIFKRNYNVIRNLKAIDKLLRK